MRRRRPHRGLRRCDAVSVGLLDPVLEQIEGGLEVAARVDGRHLGAGRFDRGELRINQVADSPVGADLAPAPGDLLDDAHAARDRCEARLERGRIERLAGGAFCVLDGAADRDQRFGQAVLDDGLSLCRKGFFDFRDRVEHHARVGIAVALGVFAEEPAAARGLHEGFADRVVILLVRLGRAGRHGREGECFVGHYNLVAQITARYCNDHHDIDRIAIGLMPPESQIPTPASVKRRFAVRLALFYSAVFAVTGTHLPFFPVWLKAVGVDAAWIGIINALPGITRFTTLPYATAFAEKRHAIRAGMMISVVATAIGFAAVGLQHQPLALLLIYALTCIMWTPVVPLTDAYALRGVIRYGFDYGPVRLWGSAAFAAGALACGYLVDSIDTRELIWVIVAWAVVAAIAGLLLQPLDDVRRRTAEQHASNALLRDAGFWLVIISAALIQGSHAAYYSFSAISWQAQGLGGFTIAGLWTLGVIAEIVVFALSPRFSLHPSSLMAIGGVERRAALDRHGAGAAAGAARDRAARPRPHFRHHHRRHHEFAGAARAARIRSRGGRVTMPRAADCWARPRSIASGAIYARIGDGLYYVMAAMAAAGALVIWSARHRLMAQPQSEASGG